MRNMGHATMCMDATSHFAESCDVMLALHAVMEYNERADIVRLHTLTTMAG
jgi:hypothetical protein